MATLTATRGDSKTWAMTFTTPGGSAYDLAGCSVRFTVKRSARHTDAQAVLRQYWSEGDESGISLTDPATGLASSLAAGILYRTIPAEESAAAFQPNYANDDDLVYVYDVQLTDADGDVTTVETGTLTVSLDVTQATTVP